MLTFNISVGNHKLPTNIPFQIIPNTRSYLDRKHLIPYSGGNPDCVIHVGYPIIPFLGSALTPQSRISEQLTIYTELAKKINAGYILIHLPKSQQEFINFKGGLQLIINQVLSSSWKGTVLLETEPFTKNMYLLMKGKSFREMFQEYFNIILPMIEHTKGRIKIILDTAHVFACGCTTLEDFIFIEELCGKNLADVIHFNGNVAGIHESDEHIPFFVTTSENKLARTFGDDYEKLIKHIFSKYRIVISENNFTKYKNINYSSYAEWAKNNNVKIIPSPIDGNYALV